MSRIIIPGARTASGQRKRALPPWLKGRASVYIDPTDDLVTGTIPADLTGAGAFTLRARLRSRVRVTATNRGAVAIGTNGATTGAFLGKVIVGGLEYYGGGLIGTTLADTVHCDQGEFADCMLRYAGGAGGALTLVVNGRSTSTVCTANITGTVAELGRLLVAGSCFGGLISDVLIDSRAISAAEYDAWRFGLEVATAPRRWWTCENPGYGATCTEEIGKTADVMTGAVWDPAVPFRRARIVEDVAACFDCRSTAYVIVAHHANIDPGTGAFSWMGWFWEPSATSGVNERIVSKTAGGAQYWRFIRSAGTHTYTFQLIDGVGNDAAYLTIPPGWNHIAGTRGPTGVMIYRNAGPPNVAVNNGRNVANAGSLYLGCASGTNVFSGRESDNGLFIGRELTWDEIEENCYDGIWPAGLTARWREREGAGTVITEDAGTAGGPYAGTASVASWSTSTRCPHARTAA